MSLAEESPTVDEAVNETAVSEENTAETDTNKEKTPEDALAELQQQYLRLAADFDNFRFEYIFTC